MTSFLIPILLVSLVLIGIVAVGISSRSSTSEAFVLTKDQVPPGSVNRSAPIYSTVFPLPGASPNFTGYGQITPVGAQVEGDGLATFDSLLNREARPGATVRTTVRMGTCPSCPAESIPGTLPNTFVLNDVPATSTSPGNVTSVRPSEALGEQAVFTDRRTARGVYRLAGLTRSSPYGCVPGLDDADPEKGIPAKQCSVTDDRMLNGSCYRGNCLADNPPTQVERYWDRFEFSYPTGYEKPAGRGSDFLTSCPSNP